MKHSAQLQTLQKEIGYTFRDSELLRESVIHPSYLQDNPKETKNNQRLEFLGDAVLDMILSEELFRLFPDEREGTLTKHRAILAKGLFLSDIAERLGLHECLLMSRAEIRSNGNKRPSSLEDALEALVGAIYLDSDLPTARSVILPWYGDIPRELKEHVFLSNPKGRLQELVQPSLGNDAIRYRVSREEGEAHDRLFEVELLLQDKLLASGKGKSKKEAEEQAATTALRQWTKQRK